MHNYGHWKKTLALLVMSALSLGASSVDAMPEGGVIRSSEGAVSQNGREMTIRQDSGRLAMDWTNFNVGKDETVRFQQPGKDALALNRVTGNQQSVIDGSLLSNGHVLLVNPNGVVIGKNASIDVGGLVASTAHVKDNFMKEFGNSTGSFTLGGVSDGKIINEGTINAEGGLVALHAAKVENSGTIKSNGGSVLMAAADTLTLTPDTDGKLNFTVDGKVAEASALNKGAITADGGTIVMTADSASDVMSTVVNNEGTLQARTLRKNEKGQILLEGNDKGQVEVSGTLDASGEGVGQDAGNIKVIGQKTIVHDGTNLLAKGDVNGGKIETSGDVLDLGDNLNIDAKGVNGKAGEWLLDPLDVIISKDNPMNTESYSGADKKNADSSDFTNGNASIAYNDPDATSANASAVNSGVTWIDRELVQNMLNAGTKVTIQAAATNGSANILVKDDITKTKGTEATLTLDAMRNITIDGKISSTADKLNVVLNADTDGNQIGVVIINADIDTNGGYFTSASGGNVVYQSDAAKTKGYGKGTFKEGGAPDPSGHTVGTYFGHVDVSGTADGKRDDRLIRTHGGAITLNGEVAIGLEGGTLTLDSGGGNVNVTGIINSGNSYGAYVYGTDTWNTLVEKTVKSYLQSGSVPAYHYQGVNYQRKIKTNADGSYVKDKNGNYVYEKDSQGHYIYLKDDNGNYLLDTTTTTDEKGNTVIVYNSQYYSSGDPHYTFSEADTQNVRWLGDGSSTAVSTNPGTGYSSVIITKGSMTLEQWLNYQLTYNAANFANRYISKDSGVTIVTETVGNKTNTYVRNADGSNVTAAQFKTYLSTALASLKSDTASTDTTKMLNGETVYNNLKDDISHLLATNWFASKDLAQGSTGGGSAVEDSYLATITTILENSLTTPNGQQILWAGGRGSGVLNKFGSTNNDKAYPYSYYGLPDDPTYQNGMYWVTGPEGEANNRKGTQFYSNVGSNWATKKYGETVYGYANWDTYKENNGTVTRYQPDNSSPFLTVGYGTTGKWDDAAMGGDTTVGFIKETNLANSSLNIKAGSGEVKLQGDIGKSKALDTVNIESTSAVKVGDISNTATEYHNGTIYADHGVYINGSNVTVGGEIHSGGTNVEATKMTDSAFSDYLDNVTIRSSGNLTVHGIEANASTDSDGNSTSRTDGEGGKIKLISTGKDGVITLGDGVDYNGNNTNGGVLKAASTAQGAVVIDAQGSQGSLVNSTTGKDAITTGNDVTTGTKGTWQVYVNSPSDYGTSLGSNLISGSNAQWTARSSANTTVTTNSSSNTPESYTDTSSNKFIFQVTPVITISGGYASKTYGDTLSEEAMAKTLTSKAVYKDSTQKNIDVTSFKNFDESGYLTYVTSSDGTKTGLSTVSVSSDGAKETATRTKGNEKVKGTDGKETNEYKKADDDNRAFYVMDVTYQDGVKTLNGYDKAANDGEVEIKRKTLNISTNGTQTYGNTTVTNGTPPYYKDQLVNGDTLADSDIQYTIATDSSYAASKGSNDTAHAGSYKNEYLTSSAEVKASDGSDASANYEVTGSGTITVTPADLYLTVGDVSTTYGKAFNTDKYTYTIDTAKGGLVNGDTQDAVLGNSFLNYTNTGAKTDASNENVKTQNAGTYALQGAASKKLSDYTVHITDGKSTVNKAKLTLTVGNTEATYGSDAWTPYTYTLQGNTNGDTVDGVRNKQISVTYTNGGEKSVASNKDVKTQDVGSYDLTGEFTLSGDTAVNYEIDKVNSKLTGTAKVNQAEIHLKLNDVSTTYGTAFTDTNTYGYDPSKLVMANGDDVSVVTGAITNKDINYTNTGDADPADKAKGAVTKGAGTGYELTGTTEKTLQNYKVVVDKANSTVNKATLHLSTGDYTEIYGDVVKVQNDLDTASKITGGEVNGDKLSDLISKITIADTSNALIPKDRTNDVGTYQIITNVTNLLDNYDVVQDKKGTVTLNPKEITIRNTMTQEYGSNDKTYAEATVPEGQLANGDRIYTKDLKFDIKSDGNYAKSLAEKRKNSSEAVTADAGTYTGELIHIGGGITHEDNTDAYKNYKVTVEGDIIVKPKDIYTDVYGTGSTLNDLTWTILKDPKDQMANGDSVNFTYKPGNLISYDDQTFDVNSFINDTQTYGSTTDVDPYGKNYIFHSTGKIQLTYNPIVKPDVWAHTGGYRPRNKIETSLPVFRVEDAKVGQYGTYGVEHREDEDKLVLSATGMRLPEPDQVPDEERTFTTTLSTEEGSGTFKLVYNGVSLKVYPQDKKAEEVVRAGDKTKNVSLSEKALYVGYTEMGLDLIDLKGVYIYFN